MCTKKSTASLRLAARETAEYLGRFLSQQQKPNRHSMPHSKRRVDSWVVAYASFEQCFQTVSRCEPQRKASSCSTWDKRPRQTAVRLPLPCSQTLPRLNSCTTPRCCRVCFAHSTCPIIRGLTATHRRLERETGTTRSATAAVKAIFSVAISPLRHQWRAKVLRGPKKWPHIEYRT
jgi:hypothetical protein